MKNPKTKLKDRPVFKWAKENLKPIAGTALTVIGDLTGRESVEALGNLISGDKSISEADQKRFALEMEIELKHFEIEETNKTKRWNFDMLSDSWLSKNIRPMVVATVALLLIYVIISGVHGKTLNDAYVGFFGTIVVTVVGGYFTLRSFKDKNIK